jgi:hypothetical protein
MVAVVFQIKNLALKNVAYRIRNVTITLQFEKFYFIYQIYAVAVKN